MIFKQLNKPGKIFEFTGLEEIKKTLKFEILRDLTYRKHDVTFEYLNDWIDNWLYPDLVAALLQNLFVDGYLKDQFIKTAIALCAPILTNDERMCEFLGFISKNKDEGAIPNDGIFFYKKFDMNNKHEFEYSNKKNNLKNIFNKHDFRNRYNFFFVAGSQCFELVDLRVRKAAILISHLMQSNLINNANTHVIVSGRNNANWIHQKVQFANEALLMKNLLINKLEYYNKKLNLPPIPINNIYEETYSRNTKDNIVGLQKSVFKIMKDFNIRDKFLNIFIISSSFHLLQIQKIVLDRQVRWLSHWLDKKINIFYIGSENPRYEFKKKDDVYIKYLFMQTIGNLFLPFYKKLGD